MKIKSGIINEKCCTHFQSNKYFLAYYKVKHFGIIKFPFSVCENCGEADFIGGLAQFYLFRLISYFDDAFELFVTDEEIEITSFNFKKE